MTVRGRIVSMSHLGGLLVDFEGVPPGLGWTVQIEGGQNIGRVDSVIGSVNSGLIHVVLSKRIDPASATGAPVEIFRSSNKKRPIRESGARVAPEIAFPRWQEKLVTEKMEQRIGSSQHGFVANAGP